MILAVLYLSLKCWWDIGHEAGKGQRYVGTRHVRCSRTYVLHVRYWAPISGKYHKIISFIPTPPIPFVGDVENPIQAIHSFIQPLTKEQDAKDLSD